MSRTISKTVIALEAAIGQVMTVVEGLQAAVARIEAFSDPVVPPPDEPPETDPPVVPPTTGVFRYPSVVANMWEAFPGEWHSRDIFRSTVAVLQFPMPVVQGGQGYSVHFFRKANYSLKPNVKVIRAFPKGWPISSAYPNIYAGTQADGSFLWNSEKIEGLKNVVKFYFKYPPHTGDWREEHWEWRYSSSPGKADGMVKAVIGGQPILDKTGWQSNSVALPNLPSIICIQDDVSNATLPEGSFTAYKDIRIEVLS